MAVLHYVGLHNFFPLPGWTGLGIRWPCPQDATSHGLWELNNISATPCMCHPIQYMVFKGLPAQESCLGRTRLDHSLSTFTWYLVQFGPSSYLGYLIRLPNLPISSSVGHFFPLEILKLEDEKKKIYGHRTCSNIFTWVERHMCMLVKLPPPH